MLLFHQLLIVFRGAFCEELFVPASGSGQTLLFTTLSRRCGREKVSTSEPAAL